MRPMQGPMTALRDDFMAGQRRFGRAGAP